jgi:hypothetical protein
VKRSIFIVAAAVGALAMPGSALAQDVHNGSDCSYTADEQHRRAVGGVVVYADTNGSGGLTGEADTSAGACANDLNLATPAGTLQGGSVEAGAGDPSDDGAYAIVDGDNENVDPAEQGDGYFGVSTFESGELDGSCDGGGDGSNSGGCTGIDGAGEVEVGVIACGNTSGNVWANTERDGCSIP